MKCPKCSSDLIEVQAMHWVLIVPDGTDDARSGDEEWDENSSAQCQECDWSGNVGDLDDDNEISAVTPSPRKLDC